MLEYPAAWPDTRLNWCRRVGDAVRHGFVIVILASADPDACVGVAEADPPVAVRRLDDAEFRLVRAEARVRGAVVAGRADMA